MTRHILERLAETNPDCEIWRDSSPLVYETWKRGVLDAAPEHKREVWETQLTRRFGAFVATAAEFAAATRETVDFVARAMEGSRRRAA